MKIFILTLLLIPSACFCQTVHVDKGRILYKGSEQIKHMSKSDLYAQARLAVLKNVRGHERQLTLDDQESGELAKNGEIRLRSNFNFLRVLEYSIKISVKKGEYKYKIDSVFVRENERHVKTTDIPSPELLKGMEISGNVASNTERDLNEIDMKLQMLLDLLHNDIVRNKTSPDGNDK